MAATVSQRGASGLQDPPRRHPRSAAEVLAHLGSHDLLVAPHVASRLHRALDGDPECAAEVVGVLSFEQRRGARCLPNPLPLTSTVHAEFDALVLADWERKLLLAAAVCVDDATETLLAFSKRSMSELIESEVGRLLAFVAGHFAFDDPRLRIWVHESAGLPERTAVHARLRSIYEQRGDARRALWHRSLSTMAGEPALTAPLLALAEVALAEGDAVWAFDVAREAVGHAAVDDLRSAQLRAGMIALANGFVDDACDLFEDASGGGSAVSAAALVTSRALRSGVVPAPEAASRRPPRSAASEWRLWGMFAGTLAMLSSERGDDAGARGWAAAAAEADAFCGGDAGFGRAATEWSDLLRGAPWTASSEQLLPHIRAALALGLAGRVGDGIRVLAAADCGEEDPRAMRGYRCSPVIRAYRGVVEALLHLWTGDLRAARETIERMALQTPLSLPLAGLAAVVARRIELGEKGACGSLSAALEFALPPGLHQDQLVDRGLAAYLEGRVEEAATHIGLWGERGFPGPRLGIPGLDEVGPVDPRTFVEPPDCAQARRVRTAVRAARAGAWGLDHQAAMEASRSIVSPFERGRVEALLGTACLTRGDHSAALRHLRAARTLFVEAGAGAWEEAVTARLVRVGEQIADASAPATAPIPVCSADPLGACRAAWAPLLTDRELQVAMLVAEGSTNREIAVRLHIALRTVEVHVGRLFAKFDVRSRAELTVLAHRTNQYS